MTSRALKVSICFCLLAAVSGAAVNARKDIVGKKAPFFKVESGDGKVLTPDRVKGKVLVIFYETKEVVEKNRALKKALNELRRDPSFPSDVSIGVPVVNCSGAFWPFTRIWRSKLKENSEKEGLTIYGDWDGKMFADYGMKRDDSNVVIIDSAGIIRYFKTGKINNEGIDQIKKLLRQLASERKPPRSRPREGREESP